MVDYLRETLQEMDQAIGDMLARRQEFAVRLAAIEASTDPSVLAAADEYEGRMEEGRPYQDAEDASSLLSEAHRRYVQ